MGEKCKKWGKGFIEHNRRLSAHAILGTLHAHFSQSELLMILLDRVVDILTPPVIFRLHIFFFIKATV